MNDVKIQPVVEIMKPANLLNYATLCGWALARAHARSGDVAVLTGYLGTSSAFEDAIADFGVAYADRMSAIMRRWWLPCDLAKSRNGRWNEQGTHCVQGPQHLQRLAHAFVDDLLIGQVIYGIENLSSRGEVELDGRPVKPYTTIYLYMSCHKGTTQPRQKYMKRARLGKNLPQSA